MNADVGQLLRREIALHFAAERITDPVLVILCLKRQGLTNELAMRVLLAELPGELSVKFIDLVQRVVCKRKRYELRGVLAALSPLLGLRAQLLPPRTTAARLTKPLLVNEIVRGILVGPETDADRQREMRRLQGIYHTLQETVETTPKRRKLLAACDAAVPSTELPTCVWCARVHAKRGLLKCLQACFQHCEAQAVVSKAREPLLSRYDLLRKLRGVAAGL